MVTVLLVLVRICRRTGDCEGATKARGARNGDNGAHRSCWFFIAACAAAAAATAALEYPSLGLHSSSFLGFIFRIL